MWVSRIIKVFKALYFRNLYNFRSMNTGKCFPLFSLCCMYIRFLTPTGRQPWTDDVRCSLYLPFYPFPWAITSERKYVCLYNTIQLHISYPISPFMQFFTKCLKSVNCHESDRHNELRSITSVDSSHTPVCTPFKTMAQTPFLCLTANVTSRYHNQSINRVRGLFLPTTCIGLLVSMVTSVWQ